MEKQTSQGNGPIQKKLYLAGIGVTHSVAPPMHNCIADSLNLPWKFEHLECPTIQFLIETFRRPDFAGGVVTMPYKKEVMAHLDVLDDLALQLGACNNVYLKPDGKLCGTNTDWRGVQGCLLGASHQGKGRPALIIGAGGAARAAVFCLATQLNCNIIYIINRDVQEVEDLKKDSQAYLKPGDSAINIVHVTSAKHAEELAPAFYAVGTVPDFEPQTPEELTARACFETFLRKDGPKGVLLDMCFKPRWTRHRKLAEKYGWVTVDGVEVIGHQIEEQWRLWAGQEAVGKVPVEKALQTLRDSADQSKVLN